MLRYSGSRRREFSGRGVIGLPAATAAVAEAAGRMNRYPAMAAVELRVRLARHLGVTAEEVAVRPGSVGVLQQIITGLCDAGDEVVFAGRSFEAYPILVELAGARSVRIPLDDAEGHDLDAMAAAVTGRTKVILLCTPNNPTGVPISHDRLEAFLQAVRSDVLVVIDEAYVEYADAGAGPDAVTLYRRYPNVCILRIFSKAYGLAGLRVGYAITTAAIAEGLRRTALPFAVSALAQRAAIASLDAGEEMEARVSAVKQERARMAAELDAQGWRLQRGRAIFCGSAPISGCSRGWWTRLTPRASWSARTRATECRSPWPTPTPTTACSGSSQPTRPDTL
ncbi:aminotransferase class I/II-fold pyridoxal phosphate-dependent enzyme [Arthrobacter sp. NPDC093125]|uniref:aminotransferase class I/II-fold pyridoxal phosphate-dependent enzyme n=1 Tax=Arthrobacter sp. NPDC093125 TaxID=3363944 RepID=UPI00381A2B5A